MLCKHHTRHIVELTVKALKGIPESIFRTDITRVFVSDSIYMCSYSHLEVSKDVAFS